MPRFEVELESGRTLIVEAPDRIAAAHEALRLDQRLGAMQGPLGIVPQAVREPVRKWVEKLPGLAQFAAETGPSLVGSTAGALTGPLAWAGVPAGGFAGEMAAQEIGLAPTSRGQLLASALAPAAAGGATKAVTGIAGWGMRRLPAIRQAIQLQEAKAGQAAIARIGQRMAPQQAAGPAFEAARQSGVQLATGDLPKTAQALNRLEQEVGPLGTVFPEGQQIMTLVGKLREGLQTGQLDFATFDQARRYLGQSVGKFEKAAGTKLGASKLLHGALKEDLEVLAQGPATATSSAASNLLLGINLTRQAKAASRMDAIVAKASKVIPGQEGTEISIPQVIQEFRALINPAHPKFKQTFAEEVKPFLPNIEQAFQQANAIAPGGVLTVKGPAALAVAQRVGAFGAMLGSLVAGPAGAAAGAILMLQAPMAAAGGLMRRPRLLSALTNVGKGQVTPALAALTAQGVRGMTREPVSDLNRWGRQSLSIPALKNLAK